MGLLEMLREKLEKETQTQNVTGDQAGCHKHRSETHYFE